MPLTFLLLRKNPTPRDPSKFPTKQLGVLAIVRLAEPIALTSILPYAWKLVRNFQVGSEENASLYAGILIAAFALAESISGMFWGALSDRIGRKPVLLIGCAGTLVSLLIVGFATNFWVALAGRVIGGLLNGNIGVIQTMVSELVTRPEHEPKAYAVMPFVWSIGGIIGPVVGGCFAEPAVNFPSFFSKDGIFAIFPYLLPNLICSALLACGMVGGWLQLEETHKASILKDRSTWSDSETPLIATVVATEQTPTDLTHESYGTFRIMRNQDDQEVFDEKVLLETSSNPAPPPSKVFSKRVIMVIVALGLFTYHAMTYDHLFPIFLQDEKADEESFTAMAGGLGMSVQRVGIILSINGIMALFVQAVIFPWMASLLGVWRCFVIVTLGHPLVYYIVPYLVMLPDTLLYPGIYTCLAIRNFFYIIAYPVLLIMLKESAPLPSQLGKINGLAASVGAASRTIASPLAGYLYGLGSQVRFTAVAWWASAAVALVGAVQILFIQRAKRREKMELIRTLAQLANKDDVKFGGPDSVVRILERNADAEELDEETDVEDLLPSDSDMVSVKSGIDGMEDDERRSLLSR